MYRTLIVKQPRADYLTRPVVRTASGLEPFQTILIKTDKTDYRGEVLICSAGGAVLGDHEPSCTCGLAELYDIKPVGQLTPAEWSAACVIEKPKKGYGWFFRNARRVVEMPFDDRGRIGFVGEYPKDQITEYPQYIELDRNGLRLGAAKARLKLRGEE